MIDAPVTSSEITDNIAAIIERTNNKIEYVNRMPKHMRTPMLMQLFEDVEYLVRYINALHLLIDDLHKQEQQHERPSPILK